jgi:hypothetical protein
MATEDSLGRIIEISLSALEELIQKNDMGPPKKFGKEAADSVKIIADMQALLAKLNKNFDKESKQTAEYIKILKKNSKKEKQKKDGDCCKELLNALKSMESVQQDSVKDFVHSNEKLISTIKGGGGGGGHGGGGGGGGAGAAGGGDGWAKKMFNAKNLTKAANYADTLAAQLIGGFSPVSIALDGVIDKTLDFSNELKRIAHATDGITGKMTDLQGQIIQTNTQFHTMQEITGQSMSNQINMWLKINKKGIKDFKQVNNLLKTSGTTATMLRSNSEATADLFADWSLNLGLSDAKLGQVGRHLNTVQKETGLMGDDLISVARSSEAVLKNLRKYGNLTAQSAQNVLSLMARAKKFDLADEMNDMLKPLQSFSDLMSTEGPAKNWAVMAASASGLTQELYNGTMLKKKENLKAFAEGIDSNINSLLKQYGVTLETIDKLPPGIRAQLDNTVKLMSGMTLDQNRRLSKVYKESSMSYQDKMNEIEKKVLSVKGSKDEKSWLAKYDKEKKDLRLATGMQAIADLKENGKISADTNSELAGYKKELGISGGAEDQVRAILSQQVKDLGLDKTKESELLSRIGSAGEMQFKDLAGEIEDAYSAQATKEKQLTNALDELTNQLKYLNSWIGTTTTGWLEWLGNKLQYWGLMFAGLIGPMLSVGGMLLKTFKFFSGKGLIEIISSGFTRMFGKIGLGGLAKAGGRVFGAAGIGIGAVSGMMEDDPNRGLAERGILGALTGSTKTGSIMSGALGIETGSAGDEAMGILGSALSGAITGFFIGGPWGALVGALAGAGGEIYKIFTSPDSPLVKVLSGWVQSLKDGFFAAIGYIGEKLSSFGNWVWNEVSYIGSQISDFVGTITGFFGDLITKAVSFLISPTIAAIEIFSNFGSYWQQFSEYFSKVFDSITSWVTGSYDRVKKFFGFGKQEEAKANGFAIGTSEITQGGLAELHKGEMVIPANEAGMIRSLESAEGSPYRDVMAKTTAKPMLDVYEKMREKNASQTSKISRNPALEKIDEISEKQLTQLISINQGIQHLIQLIDNPKKSGKTTAQSRSNYVSQKQVLNTVDFGEWPVSETFRGMGGAQINSDGVIS